MSVSTAEYGEAGTAKQYACMVHFFHFQSHHALLLTRIPQLHMSVSPSLSRNTQLVCMMSASFEASKLTSANNQFLPKNYRVHLK